jgi:flagellar protein FlaF
LEAARQLHQTKDGPIDEFRAALRKNWRLWTIFQASLLDAECQVPMEIRGNLLGLANFIDRQTAELLAAPEPAKVDALVHINRQISEGLLEGMRASAARAAAPAETTLSLRQTV